MLLRIVPSRCIRFTANNSVRHVSDYDRRRKKWELQDRDEEELERMRPKPLADIQARIDESKKKLVWRQKPEQEFSFVGIVSGLIQSEERRSSYLEKIVRPIEFNLTWSKWKAERKKRRDFMERISQIFNPRRHEILGNNLAAAHFLVHRGAQVRFTRSPEWVCKDMFGEYELPSRFDPNWVIQDIICQNVQLFYEGLQNMRRLFGLKTLSFKNVKNFDDWYLDRVAGNEYDNLEVLDISGTDVTAYGLTAIPKIPSLRLLILSDIKRSVVFELTLILLQDQMPHLEIREAIEPTTDDKKSQ